jgi:2-isopropylmalate synthase
VVSIVGKAALEHVEKVLATTGEENRAMVFESVSFLVERGKQVFFDAEHYFDAFRSDPRYAISVLVAAARAGARLLVLCDTNGGTLPHEITAMVQSTRETLLEEFYPAAEILGIHAHNDSGVAVANTLQAVIAGCGHIQGTVNGYGERVGNADLLVCIADLQLKMGYQLIEPRQLERLTELSHFVASTMNISPDAHHPYSGSNAFAHKAGLHLSSIARYKPSYEHIDPARVGNFSRTVISELSGRSALVSKADELGVDIPDSATELTGLLEQVKARELQGFSYEVAEASLTLFLADLTGSGERRFELESFRVITDKHSDGRALSEATIKLVMGNRRVVTTGEGVGPVNALDRALRMAITEVYPEVENFELTDFKVRVLDESVGTGAVTRVLIETSDGTRSWGTIGVSENIIEASWDALVDSIVYGLLQVGK